MTEEEKANFRKQHAECGWSKAADYLKQERIERLQNMTTEKAFEIASACDHDLSLIWRRPERLDGSDMVKMRRELDQMYQWLKEREKANEAAK